MSGRKNASLTIKTLVIAVSLTLLATGFTSLLSLLATLVLIAYLVMSILPRRLAGSWVSLAVISIILYSIVGQLLVLCVWIFNRNFPLQHLHYVILIFTAIWVGWQRNLKLTVATEPKQRLRFIDSSDLFALPIATFMIILILVGPAYRSIKEFGYLEYRSVSVDTINTSMDDSSHLSRFNDRLQLDRGVLYSSNKEELVVQQNTINTYPPGWHSINAVLTRAFAPDIEVGGQSIVAYALTKLFWSYVMFIIFARLVYKLCTSLNDTRRISEKLSMRATLFVAPLVIFFSYYMLLEQYKEGFYNFMPVLTYLLVMSLMILNADFKRRNDKLVLLVFLAFMSAGVGLSWILVLPGLLLSVLWLSVYRTGFSSIRQYVGELQKILLVGLPPILLAIAGICIQIILLRSGSGRSFSEGVNDPGSITHHSVWYHIFIVLGTILCMFIRSAKDRKLDRIYIIVAGLLACSAFIYVFQIVTTGHTEYYFTKTLNTVYVILVPVAIFGSLCVFKVLGDNLNTKALSSVLAVLFLLALPIVIGIDPVNTSNLGYVAGKREFTPGESLFIFNYVERRTNITISERVDDVFIYKPGNFGYNVVGNNILRSIQPVEECDHMIYQALTVSNETDLIEKLHACATDGHSLSIITDLATGKRLESMIGDTQRSNNISILYVQ